MSSEQIDFKAVTSSEISAWLENHGERSYRAKQIAAWTRHRGVDSFEEMTDLSKKLRLFLSKEARITRIKEKDRQTSSDGTTKFLFELEDGHTIESVWIPEEDRATLCISSQVGCKFACKFCLTGYGGFIRDLSPGEIVDQVIQAKRVVPNNRVTNIVFMGMGEPLDNYGNVLQSLKVITDPESVLVGVRKITVSTCGLAPGIERLANDFPSVKLAISLNAASDFKRDKIMPVNKTYPISKLAAAILKWPLPQGRRITFEYVMLSGINDSDEDAENLHQLTKQIPSTINLIPFNSCPELHYAKPSDKRIEKFRNILIKHNRVAIIRSSRGSDILAACGQLREREKSDD